MTTTDITNVHEFVDANLELIFQVGLMRMPHEVVPLEMRDGNNAGIDEEGYAAWKEIPSTVSQDEIRELEQKTGFRYPELYVEFLRYKQFCELFPVAEITFFDHSIHQWKQVLIDRYYKSWLPEKLIGQGYIYFADYSDWGMVCFDTTEQNLEDNDCPIIMIDHEALYDNPVPKEILYPSFAAMMRSLLEAQQNPAESEED